MATEQARGDLVNTLIAAAIGAFLGYMAFGSFWHGALFLSLIHISEPTRPY